MKPTLALTSLLTALSITTTQAAQPADMFDFWVGDWNVTWKNADGSAGKARNRVSKALDGQVIEEHFDEDAGDALPLLRGRSLSAWHKASGTWRQAWADNQGGFFAFTAQADGDRPNFMRASVVRCVQTCWRAECKYGSERAETGRASSKDKSLMVQ